MSQRPPRPRAFRLDDRRVAVDDQPASLAPEAIIRSQNDPIPAGVPAPIDEAELEVEAAQKSGLIARSRLTLGGLAWTGLGGLVSLALGLWATNLIEGLFAKAESLGIIGVVFGLVFLVGLIGLAAREIIAVGAPDADRGNARRFRQRARSRRSRRGAPPGRPAGRALSQPAGDGARARASRGSRRARSSTGATSSTSLSARSFGPSTTRRKARSPPPPSGCRW